MANTSHWSLATGDETITTAVQIYRGRFPAYWPTQACEAARDAVLADLDEAITEYCETCDYHDDGNGYWAHGQEAGERATDRAVAALAAVVERYYALRDDDA